MNPTPHPTAPTPAAPPGAATPPGTGGERRGQLYPQVAAYLAGRPGELLKVGEITRAIGAPSAGAVFEALKRMAAAGFAEHRTGPHRFAITPAGIAAAGTLPPPAPRAPGQTGPRRGKAQPVTRPGGGLYFPRRLAGSTDIDVLRRLRDKKVPVLLYGPPGTGKTSLVEAAFPDVITLAGNGDTIVEDFVGSFIPNPGGGFDYTYGPLVTAMRDGKPLFVDDATLIPPKVLAVLYPAMDGRAQITIPGYRNERVEAIDGFYVIAGHNPGVHGAVLTEALASRFSVHIEVTTDMHLARHLGVPAPVIDVAVALNQQLRDGTIGWAPQLRELLAYTHIARSLGQKAALANLAAIAPADDREQVLAEIRKRFTDITPLTLGPQR
jgi:nitric oxide reductase NorQ protein